MAATNRKTEQALADLLERQADNEREDAVRKLHEVKRRVEEALEAIASGHQPFRMISSPNMGIADAAAEVEARVHAWLLVESQRVALNHLTANDLAAMVAMPEEGAAR